MAGVDPNGLAVSSDLAFAATESWDDGIVRRRVCVWQRSDEQVEQVRGGEPTSVHAYFSDVGKWLSVRHQNGIDGIGGINVVDRAATFSEEARILGEYEECHPRLAPVRRYERFATSSKRTNRMTTRIVSSLLIALALAACGAEAEPLTDTGTDLSNDPTVDSSTDQGSTTVNCPAGPRSPLGESCTDEGEECGYGYDPPECGGITVTCTSGEWVELVHTDPSSDCIAPGTIACADVQDLYEEHVLGNQACSNPDECVVIEGADSCDCSAVIFNGSGDAIHHEAAGYARQLADIYWDCLDSGEIETAMSVCDAGPGEPACIDGQCRTVDANCAGNDAGSPDRGMPDAG